MKSIKRSRHLAKNPAQKEGVVRETAVAKANAASEGAKALFESKKLAVVCEAVQTLSKLEADMVNEAVKAVAEAEKLAKDEMSRHRDLERTLRAFDLVARSKYTSPLVKPILRLSIQDLQEGFGAYADRVRARIHQRLEAASRDFLSRQKKFSRRGKRLRAK